MPGGLEQGPFQLKAFHDSTEAQIGVKSTIALFLIKGKQIAWSYIPGGFESQGHCSVCYGKAVCLD